MTALPLAGPNEMGQYRLSRPPGAGGAGDDEVMRTAGVWRWYTRHWYTRRWMGIHGTPSTAYAHCS